MAVRRAGQVALVVALLLAGCGTDATRESKPDAKTDSGHSYVGEIDASPASISLKLHGTELTGAVCQDSRVSVPLDPGIVKNDSAELAHNGQSIGTVSITSDLAVGTIELAGKKHKFRAEAVPGMADLCAKR